VTPVQQVADGVHRLGTDWVGWYLYDVAGAVTVVDCGFPGYFDSSPPRSRTSTGPSTTWRR
jgi:hypothetical protein